MNHKAIIVANAQYFEKPSIFGAKLDSEEISGYLKKVNVETTILDNKEFDDIAKVAGKYTINKMLNFINFFYKDEIAASVKSQQFPSVIFFYYAGHSEIFNHLPFGIDAHVRYNS